MVMMTSLSLQPLEPGATGVATIGGGSTPTATGNAPDFASLLPVVPEVASAPAALAGPPVSVPQISTGIERQEAAGQCRQETAFGSGTTTRVSRLASARTSAPAAEVPVSPTDLAQVSRTAEPQTLQVNCGDQDVAREDAVLPTGRRPGNDVAGTAEPAASAVQPFLHAAKLLAEQPKLFSVSGEEQAETGAPSDHQLGGRRAGQPGEASGPRSGLDLIGQSVPQGAERSTVAAAPPLGPAFAAAVQEVPLAPGAQTAVTSASPSPHLALTGDFGDRLGVAIARQVRNGREELTVRMDPAELGRIEVQLAFEEGGSLRAVVSADSATVVDTMRRDLGEIVRALADAGVRADGQSFRFERGSSDAGGSAGAGTGSGGRGWGEQRGQGHPQGEQRRGGTAWQRVRLRSGTLDLMA